MPPQWPTPSDSPHRRHTRHWSDCRSDRTFAPRSDWSTDSSLATTSAHLRSDSSPRDSRIHRNHSSRSSPRSRLGSVCELIFAPAGSILTVPSNLLWTATQKQGPLRPPEEARIVKNPEPPSSPVVKAVHINCAEGYARHIVEPVNPGYRCHCWIEMR